MRVPPTRKRRTKGESQVAICRLKIHRVEAIGPFSKVNALNSSPTLGCVVMCSCGEEEDPQKHVLPLFPLPSSVCLSKSRTTRGAEQSRNHGPNRTPPHSEKMIIRNDEKVIRRKQHFVDGPTRSVIIALVRSSANTQNPIQGGKPQQQHKT